jgi:RHS repeat-associated protein
MVQQPLDITVASTVQHYDEYGNKLDGTSATRYGSLGSYQRSSNTLSGLTLMGVRLYDSTTGRFLSVDPVYGGNANAYSYPLDPVNRYDLDGRKPIKKYNKTGFSCGWKSCTVKLKRRHAKMLQDILLFTGPTIGGIATYLQAVAGASGPVAWGAGAVIAVAAGFWAGYIAFLLKYWPKRGIKVVRVHTGHLYMKHQ